VPAASAIYGVKTQKKTKIKGTQQGRRLLPSHEDVKRSSIRNVEFSSFLNIVCWAKCKNPVILSVIHHCQSHSESASNISYYILDMFFLSALYFLPSCASSFFQFTELSSQQDTTIALSDLSWHCHLLFHASVCGHVLFYIRPGGSKHRSLRRRHTSHEFLRKL
jgi:hypothetical protein